MAKKLLKGIHIHLDLHKQLIHACKRKGSETASSNDAFDDLEDKYFELITHPFTMSILSLLETDDARDNPEWVAQRLGITTKDALEILDKLEILGLIEKGSENRRIPAGKQYKTSNDVANANIRHHHHLNLEFAHKALDEVDVTHRDFSTMTFALDISKLPEAKKRITQFRRELTAFLECDAKKEVYRLSIQLFPLTKIEQDYE